MKEDQRVDRVIRQYQDLMRAHATDWQVQRKREADQERERVKNARSLDVLGLGSEVDDFMEKVFPGTLPENVTFEQFLEAYLISMKSDLQDCLSSEERLFLKKVHLRFLPIGLANAQCVNADVTGRVLPFYVAFINEGLYFALNQLFTALIFEELQGDLISFRRDGQPAFEAAIRLYLEPTSTNIEAVPLDLGDDTATGEVQAHLSSVTTIALQFISLHEFAHAWLGHHAAHASSRLAMIKGVEERVVNPDVWEHEFEADAFAFRALMARTRSVESHWAHAFVLYLFFGYLAEIEGRIGKPLSPDHPPPSVRANRIVSQLKREFPDAAHLEKDILRLESLIAKWTGNNMAKKIQISVLSDNTSLLEAAVTSGELSDINGCEVSVAGKNRAMGFGSSTELLMLAIGIAGGVPAGVIANAIYDRLKGSDPDTPAGFTVMIGDDVAKDLESFEVLLKRKIDEASES